MGKNKNTWGLALCCLLWFFAIVINKNHNSTNELELKKWRYLPNSSLIKNTTLGHGETLGSILWVYCVLEYGLSQIDEKKFPELPNLIFTVLDLLPNFKEGYIFGGLVLSDNPTTIKQSNEILQRGIKIYPNEFRLRLFLAMNYLTLDSNYLLAAETLRPIAHSKNTPDYIRALIPRLFVKGGEKESALNFLLAQFYQSNISINQNLLIRKITWLYKKNANKKDFQKVENLLIFIEKRPELIEEASNRIKKELSY